MMQQDSTPSKTLIELIRELKFNVLCYTRYNVNIYFYFIQNFTIPKQ